MCNRYVTFVDSGRFSTASQASSVGRAGASRKNVDGTSSTDNEPPDGSTPKSQIPDQNDAAATSTTTLPVTASDPGTSASDITVAAAVEMCPGPPAVNASTLGKRLVPESAGHLPLSG